MQAFACGIEYHVVPAAAGPGLDDGVAEVSLPQLLKQLGRVAVLGEHVHEALGTRDRVVEALEAVEGHFGGEDAVVGGQGVPQLEGPEALRVLHGPTGHVEGDAERCKGLLGSQAQGLRRDGGRPEAVRRAVPVEASQGVEPRGLGQTAGHVVAEKHGEQEVLAGHGLPFGQRQGRWDGRARHVGRPARQEAFGVDGLEVEGAQLQAVDEGRHVGGHLVAIVEDRRLLGASPGLGHVHHARNADPPRAGAHHADRIGKALFGPSDDGIRQVFVPRFHHMRGELL